MKHYKVYEVVFGHALVGEEWDMVATKPIEALNAALGLMRHRTHGARYFVRELYSSSGDSFIIDSDGKAVSA